MLCVIFIVLFIINLFVPDPLPFLDEIILALASAGVCERGNRTSQQKQIKSQKSSPTH